MAAEKINMEVRKATESDMKLLVEFNKFAFPMRKGVDEFIKYRLKETPDLFYFIAIHNHKIIGQRMAFLQKLIYKDQIFKTYWAADLVVDENFRGIGVGKKIFDSMDTSDYFYFSTNLASATKKMYEKKGAKEIGEFKFFFRPLNLHKFSKFLFKILLRKNIDNNIRLKVSVPSSIDNFKRITTAEELVEKHPPLNFSEKLQTYKDETYFKWRYFYKENKYFCYVSKDTFFIFRPIYWKEMKCLMVVDFRGEPTQAHKALKKIAKQNKFSGLLWASTDLETQKFLKRNFYINYFKTAVVSNFKNSDETIATSFHFSDSDLDFNYSNTPFVYS